MELTIVEAVSAVGSNWWNETDDKQNKVGDTNDPLDRVESVLQILIGSHLAAVDKHVEEEEDSEVGEIHHHIEDEDLCWDDQIVHHDHQHLQDKLTLIVLGLLQ
jgi:hypothetical protein